MTRSTDPVAVLAPVVGPRIAWLRTSAGLFKLKNPTPKRIEKALECAEAETR